MSHFWEKYGAIRPAFVVVEPEQADCLLQSARAGRPTRASGTVDSVMAGLACGEPSPLAWSFLETSVDAFITVSDAQAIESMQALAWGADNDVPVVAGESGAAGLAGLMALHRTPAAEALGLDARSHVLLLNTEGATAPALYEALVGQSAEAVLQRQAIWRVDSAF